MNFSKDCGIFIEILLLSPFIELIKLFSKSEILAFSIASLELFEEYNSNIASLIDSGVFSINLNPSFTMDFLLIVLLIFMDMSSSGKIILDLLLSRINLGR